MSLNMKNTMFDERRVESQLKENKTYEKKGLV